MIARFVLFILLIRWSFKCLNLIPSMRTVRLREGLEKVLIHGRYVGHTKWFSRHTRLWILAFLSSIEILIQFVLCLLNWLIAVWIPLDLHIELFRQLLKWLKIKDFFVALTFWIIAETDQRLIRLYLVLIMIVLRKRSIILKARSWVFAHQILFVTHLIGYLFL